MSRNIVALLNSDDGRALVRKKCRAAGVKIAIFEQLINAEIAQQGKMRKAGLWDDFDEILGSCIEGEES